MKFSLVSTEIEGVGAVLLEGCDPHVQQFGDLDTVKIYVDREQWAPSKLVLLLSALALGPGNIELINPAMI
jgi:hypothetical protein